MGVIVGHVYGTPAEVGDNDVLAIRHTGGILVGRRFGGFLSALSVSLPLCVPVI